MSVLAHRRAVHVGADAASPPRIGVARETARRTVRVLLPMALTTLLVLAVLWLCGVELTLFHLVALILAAGLGDRKRGVEGKWVSVRVDLGGRRTMQKKKK